MKKKKVLLLLLMAILVDRVTELTLTRLSHWTLHRRRSKTSSLSDFRCVCVVDKHQLMMQMQMQRLHMILQYVSLFGSRGSAAVVAGDFCCCCVCVCVFGKVPSRLLQSLSASQLQLPTISD